MRAIEAIKELEKLIEEHGDLEITVAVSTYEYSLTNPSYGEEGPCRNIGAVQRQSPEERFVFEAKDNISNSVSN